MHQSQDCMTVYMYLYARVRVYVCLHAYNIRLQLAADICKDI